MKIKMENLKPISEYTSKELAEHFKRTREFIDQQMIKLQKGYVLHQQQLYMAAEELFIR